MDILSSAVLLKSAYGHPAVDLAQLYGTPYSKHVTVESA